MPDKVIIFETSGKIDEVLGPEDSFKRVDIDMLDFGTCPCCNGDTAGSYHYCETCDVTWFDESYEDIYDKIST